MQNIQKILKDRYFLDGENSWEQLAKRVSALYPESFEDIRAMKFIPSSPTLMNANTGGKRKGTLSSCFPMEIKDSMDDIMDAMKDAAVVTKNAGGIGFDFSYLRGSNENVKSVGRNSGGIMGFIGIYNSVLDGVRQGGARKGAGMALLSIYHPDILKFLVAKKDLKQYNRVNFSVKIDDDFYRVLDKNPNKLFKVRNVVDKKEHVLEEGDKQLSYKDMWDKVIDMAWLCAEPGIFNESIVSERSTLRHIQDTPTCNPCLPEFSNFLTTKGIVEFKDIKIGDMVWSKDGWTTVINKWYTGDKDVYMYSTRAGDFYSTEDHKVVSNGIKVEVSDADNIDLVKGIQNEFVFNIEDLDPTDIMDGLVIGDGSRNINPTKNYDVYLNIGDNDKDYFTSYVKDNIIGQTYPSDKYSFRINTTITKEELPLIPVRKIPNRFIFCDPKKIRGFLCGLYSANGSICGRRITLKSTSYDIIKSVQLMLSSIGITSYYTINKPTKIKWANGEYTSKKSYDLNVSDIFSFYSQIRFLQKYKNDKIEAVINLRRNKEKEVNNKLSYEIISKTLIGKLPVYDLTVDNESHTFWCSGFNVSNCSEFVSTVPRTSCNLGSINLVKLVDENTKEFDIKEFSNLIGRSTRFLNKVLDNNVYPLKSIEEVTLKARSIGLGFMGLAHALYKMGIPYDSEEGYKWTKEMVLYLTLRSMQESVQLAKENGKSFEWFNKAQFFKANERLFSKKKVFDIDVEKLTQDIEKYGCYNSSQTSTAPTGCQVPKTLVVTNKGIFKLSELIPFKDEDRNKWVELDLFSAHNEQWIKKEITKGYINGYVKTKKIILKTNIELEASLQHKYRVLVNDSYVWREAQDIKIGDILLYDIGGYRNCYKYVKLKKINTRRINMQEIRMPTKLNKDFALLLGLIYSDGSIHESGVRIHFNYNDALIKKVKTLIKKVFNIEVKSYKEHTCESIYLTSTLLLDYLRINDLIKEKALKVEIPLAIRKSPKDVIKRFFDGYWLGDGSSNKGNKYIDTFSKEMAQQLAVVGRAIGFNMKISIYDKSKDKQSYSNNICYRVYFKKYGSVQGKCDVNKIKLNTRRIYNLCKKFGKNLFFDEVIKVIDSENMTLDLSVPEGNTYISNSYISHNSIGTLAQTSNGIEPVFGLVHIRKVENDDKTFTPMVMDDLVFRKLVESKYADKKNQIYEYVSKNNGSCQGCEYISKEDQKVYKVAADIKPDAHLEMLASAANVISLSISKTINVPNTATKEEISKVYLDSYKKGVIGVTTYREGCREGVLVHSIDENRASSIVERKDAPKRPETLDCDIYNVKVRGDSYTILLGKLQGMLYEIFVAKTPKEELSNYEKGKIHKVKRNHYNLVDMDNKVLVDNLGKKFGDSQYRTLARFVSMSLRHGVPLKFIVEQLSKSEDFMGFDKCVARILNKYIKNGETYESEKCPECSGKLFYFDGCIKCHCGWSKCG